MSESTGTVKSFERRDDSSLFPIWKKVVTFALISGNDTGLTTIPINGLLQKIILKLPDMASAEGTLDLSLTDEGGNTVFSVVDRPESTTYTYSVNEPFTDEINVILGFTNPGTNVTVTVTLKGF